MDFGGEDDDEGDDDDDDEDDDDEDDDDDDEPDEKSIKKTVAKMVSGGKGVRTRIVMTPETEHQSVVPGQRSR